MLSHRVARIVSGGQTGADRAGLDVAISLGLAYGGWCPPTGWAEDYPDPPGLLADYPHLRPTSSADPDERTYLNVRDSHATLVIRHSASPSPGADLTARAATALERPCLVAPDTADAVVRWLSTLGSGLTVNVAGPRESEEPGAYQHTRRLLLEVLRAVTSSAR